MPTYAILGGTGKIGAELIRNLASSPDAVLHVYARSQKKLLDMHPILADPASPHKTFIGDINDVDLITDCIAGAWTVFGTVGTNINKPGCHVAQDLAKVIIGAISKLQGTAQPGDFKPPTVLFVTSAGMTRDERVKANFPAPLHAMIQYVAKHIYEDFRRACALFENSTNSWIPVIFVCAPGLEQGPSQGKVFAGVNVPKNAPIYTTYTDLATGMIQAATEPEELLHKDIAVAGEKQPPLNHRAQMRIMVLNLMGTFTPRFWWYGHRKGWWNDQ